MAPSKRVLFSWPERPTNGICFEQVSVLTIDTEHPEKVRIARRLRGETTMSLKRIAERLGMGSWTYVSNLLGQKPKGPRGQEVLLLCQ